jgi:hypothetical protein
MGDCAVPEREPQCISDPFAAMPDIDYFGSTEKVLNLLFAEV